MYRKLRLWCDGVVSSDDVHMMALYFFDWMILHVKVFFLYRKSWTELILFVLARESSWEGFTWSICISLWFLKNRIWFFFSKNQVGRTRFLQATRAVKIKFEIDFFCWDRKLFDPGIWKITFCHFLANVMLRQHHFGGI